MIGFLRGTLAARQPPALAIDVGGVGYELEAPLSTFYDLPAIGEPVTLFTHQIVRDDAHLLFGFAHEAERRLFRTLLKVSGVGAKMALAVLSGMSADEFARCIEDDDVATLTRLPGIGEKTARRLIVEMRDRLAAEAWQTGPVAGPAGATAAAAGPDPVADAVSALVALGYGQSEARRMIRRLDTDGVATEDLIRHALKG